LPSSTILTAQVIHGSIVRIEFQTAIGGWHFRVQAQKIGTTLAMLKKIVLLNRPPLWDNSSP
jgi:hypothetical protein